MLWSPANSTDGITHCAQIVCCFRDVYHFIIAVYCILFGTFLISKINVALQLTKLLLKKVTTTTTTSVVYCSMASVHGANGQQLAVTGCVKKQVKMLALN